MSLEQKIMDQLKQAMRDKNEIALRTLRSIKAAILVEKTSANSKEELSEGDEIKILQKMAKQRKDSLDIFNQQNRPDLAKKEEEELTIINTFLPKQLNNEEIENVVKDVMNQLGASAPSDMGKVMGVVSKQLSGQADGKVIAETVKRLLASS